MKISVKGIELIEFFEGFRSSPYLDSVNIPTIGIGTTYYPDGTKVKMSDKPITKEFARELLAKHLVGVENDINRLVKSNISQNQFDAIVSFCYNVGIGNFKSSTLLKLININPSDTKIKDQFLRWNKAGGKELLGLTKRRTSESQLYFS